MKLTSAQENALLDAYKRNGRLFHCNNKKHSTQVLRRLEKMGLLEQERNWTIWTLTEKGYEALKDVY